MKTLANCTPKEFAVQTAKLAAAVKRYANDLSGVRAKLPKLPENATEEDIRKAGMENFFDILSWAMETNLDGTMELCGAICFMDADSFASLDPADGEDGVTAVFECLLSSRVLAFFAAALRTKRFIEKL